jgi:hypothetical protein
MADPWQQSSGATRGTPGQFASLPQGPILGDLDGTYLGRLVVEAWQPNDPSMNDGLWYQGGPVGSPSEAMHLFQEMARQLDHALRHWSPSPLSHTIPQMAQTPAQGSNGGRLLGHLIAETWRDAGEGAEMRMLYAVALAQDVTTTPQVFAVDTVNRLQRRLQRQRG